MEMNYPGSEEDAARALTGIKTKYSYHPPRDRTNMQPITDRDFRELELHLSDHPHISTLYKICSRPRPENLVCGDFVPSFLER